VIRQPQPSPHVRLVIDRLVIDGVDLPAREVDAMVAAVSAELRERVLDNPDRPRQWTSATTLRAPGIQLAADAPAAEVGRQAGAAAHAALNRSAP